MLFTMKTWLPRSATCTRSAAAFAGFAGLGQTAQAQQDLPGLASGLGQMLFGLAVVIALLLATLWLIKRLSAPRGPAAGLKVLGGVAVGSRERLVLVEVGDKVLVLGVTSNSINTLHTTDADSLALTPSAGGESSEPAFANWLRQSLDRRRGGA